MIANFPLATGNQLNCFIGARDISIILPGALVLFLLFVDFYMLINHLLKKRLTNKISTVDAYNYVGLPLSTFVMFSLGAKIIVHGVKIKFKDC